MGVIKDIDEGFYITPGYCTVSPSGVNANPVPVVNPNAPNPWQRRHVSARFGNTFAQAIADVPTKAKLSSGADYADSHSSAIAATAGAVAAHGALSAVQRLTTDAILPAL